MKAERRTMLPGTARKPAALKRLSPQPANFDGTLSHQLAPPGPPGIGVMSFRRNEIRTAFLAHWLTCHWPTPRFSATRSAPESSASSVASTASRTGPLVPELSWSRFSQASSMAFASAAWSISGFRFGVVGGRRAVYRLVCRRATVPLDRGSRLDAEVLACRDHALEPAGEIARAVVDVRAVMAF